MSMEKDNKQDNSEQSVEVMAQLRSALARFELCVLSFEDELQKLGYIVGQFPDASQPTYTKPHNQLSLVQRINSILLQLRHLFQSHARKFDSTMGMSIIVIQAGELDDNAGPSKPFPIHLERRESVYDLFLNLVQELLEVKVHIESLEEFPIQKDNTLSLAIDAFCVTLRRTVFKASAGPGYPVLDNVDQLIAFCNRAASAIEAMTGAMKAFVEFVYPAAQEARQNIISKLQSETTVATFLSGVTATTLQITLGESAHSALNSVVNGFWFSSLIFSVLSAFSALLDLLKHYRRHGSVVIEEQDSSLLVSLWKELSLLFLLVSVATFIAGLTVFTWASDQVIAIKVVNLLVASGCFLAIISRSASGYGTGRRVRPR